MNDPMVSVMAPRRYGKALPNELPSPIHLIRIGCGDPIYRTIRMKKHVATWVSMATFVELAVKNSLHDRSEAAFKRIIRKARP
jgi:hypothetical protein